MRVFSGIQPTGNLHLGNYLGAIRNWVKMQDYYESNLFCVVDLHAITSSYNEGCEDIYENSLFILASYIACGIDIQKSKIFLQSFVPEHTELAWILGCITTIGSLNRMTQFKDKSAKLKQESSLGLYSYPVLMASDILLYDADVVPVGEDQKQHIELTRDIALKFNNKYDAEIFKLPDPIIPQKLARVMSLKDGTKKMSKSDNSDLSRINLTDSADIIRDKIKRAKTDSIQHMEIESLPGRPELRNLIDIYSEFSGNSVESICSQFSSLGFAKFKSDLADIIVENITPISQKINALMNEKSVLKKVLKEGSEYAKNIANQKINEVKRYMKLIDN